MTADCRTRAQGDAQSVVLEQVLDLLPLTSESDEKCSGSKTRTHRPAG